MKSNHVNRRTALECLLGVASGPGMSANLRAGYLRVRLEIGESTIDVSFDSEQFLRAINRPGGTIESHGPLDRAIEVGDKVTQGKILMYLYCRMASKPAAVDLPDLGKQLGVVRDNCHVTSDDRAPLASIRASIVVNVRL